MVQNALLSPSAPHNKKIDIHLLQSEASGCMASMKSHKEYNKGPVLSRAALCYMTQVATTAAPVQQGPTLRQADCEDLAVRRLTWRLTCQLSLANHSCKFPDGKCLEDLLVGQPS